MKIIKNRYFIYAVKLVIAAGIFYFIGKYVYENSTALGDKSFTVNYGLLFLSAFILMVTMAIQSFNWHLITKISGVNIPIRKSFVIRTYSELGKYVPGRAALYGVLFYSYRQENVPLNIITYCSLFESFTFLLSSIIVAVLSVSFVTIDIDPLTMTMSIVIAIILLFFTHPRILKSAINLMLGIMKKGRIEKVPGYEYMILFILIGIVLWLFYGIAFYLMAKAIGLVNVNIFYITGAFALSSFVGFIAVFVPAGLGVREGMLIVLMSKIAGEYLAGIAAILSRCLIIASDIIIFLAAVILDYTSKFNLLKRYFSSGQEPA